MREVIKAMNIEEVKNYIYKLGTKIGLEKNSKLYPFFSESEQVFNDGPSVYVDNTGYHYVVMERGKINKIIESVEIDDIIYTIFESITFSLASEYEASHRRIGEDSRKQLWEKQLELLGKINERFAEKCKQEIDRILKIAPYRN